MPLGFGIAELEEILVNEISIGEVDNDAIVLRFNGTELELITRSDTGVETIAPIKIESLKIEGSTNTVTLTTSPSLSQDLTFQLPLADGTNGQALITNGSGELSFADIASAIANLTDVDLTGLQDGQILVYNNGTGNWETQDLPSGSNDRDIFQAIDIAGNTSISTSGYAAIPLDTQIRVDSAFSHTPDNAEVTFNELGWYEITYHITIDSTNGGRSSSSTRLTADEGSGFNAVPGSFATMYHRQTSQGATNASVTILREFDAGDQIRLEAVRLSGNGSLVTLPNGVGLTIRNADASGAQGPIGPAGGANELSELTDADTTGVNDQDILVYNNSAGEWQPQAQQTIPPIPDDLSDLTDVDTTGVSDQDILVYNNSASEWQPQAQQVIPQSNVFYAFDATGNFALTGTYQDIALDTVEFSDSAFSFVAGNSEVTILETGRYKIDFSIGLVGLALASEGISRLTESIGGGGFNEIGGTLVYINPVFGGDSQSSSKQIIRTVAAGTVIRIESVVLSGGLSTVPNTVGLVIEKL